MFIFTVPHRKEHEANLEKLKLNGQNKIVGAPFFPYQGNSLMVQMDTEAEDGGFSKVKEFVDNDPYVKKKLVSAYTIKEVYLRGATSEFDRLSSKFVLRS